MNKQELQEGIDIAYECASSLKDIITSPKYKQIIIIGNGGSNSIASHISQDYTKQLGKRAFSFSDPSRLTCYINDYGRDEAYRQFVKEFADKDDTLVILISSSGNSMNILNTADYCESNGIRWISLSGFSSSNPLCKMQSEYRLLNFWVPSKDYGVVECVHQIFLHSILGN